MEKWFEHQKVTVYGRPKNIWHKNYDFQKLTTIIKCGIDFVLCHYRLVEFETTIYMIDWVFLSEENKIYISIFDNYSDSEESLMKNVGVMMVHELSHAIFYEKHKDSNWHDRRCEDETQAIKLQTDFIANNWLQ